MRVNYAIVFVSDMERSVAFYRDVIGLPLRFESTHWTEFATEGATLALHLSEEPGVPKARAKGEAPGSCRPGLSVPNLDEFHQRMVANGVACLQEPKVVFGSRVAQYSDPDGLTISVGEHRRGS
jgi:lactoylglutathione lyase